MDEFIELFTIGNETILFNKNRYSKYRFYSKNCRKVKIKGLTIMEFIDKLQKYVYYIEYKANRDKNE